MPKFVGRSRHSLGAERIEDNSGGRPGFVRVTYQQAAMVRRHAPNVTILASLDTTDKGSRHTFAKRWYRWFVPTKVAARPWATEALRARAGMEEVEAAVRSEISGGRRMDDVRFSQILRQVAPRVGLELSALRTLCSHIRRMCDLGRDVPRISEFKSGPRSS
jgi:hypothetical protein